MEFDFEEASLSHQIESQLPSHSFLTFHFPSTPGPSIPNFWNCFMSMSTSSTSTDNHGIWKGRTRSTGQLSAHFQVTEILKDVRGHAAVPCFAVEGMWMHKGCSSGITLIPQDMFTRWAPEVVATFREKNGCKLTLKTPFTFLVSIDQDQADQQRDTLKMNRICPSLFGNPQIDFEFMVSGMYHLGNDRYAGISGTFLPSAMWDTFASWMKVHVCDQRAALWKLNTPFYITFKAEKL